MNIQFNLIPDVKNEYTKTKRTKRMIVSSSIVVSVISVGVVLALFSVVQIGQKNHIKNLDTDIDAKITDLQSIEDLDKILTIQNQLLSAPALHEQKPEMSRIFSYLTEVTPIDVRLRKVSLSVVDSTMNLTGTADSLASVNVYADTLKFATYTTSDDRQGNPFTQVITELSRNEVDASYNISLVFDEVIFDNTIDVDIDIPNQVTTRSVTGKPDLDLNNENSLFEIDQTGGDQ